MSNISFDFLTDSFLFRDSLINSNYHSVNEIDLKRELSSYREHIRANLENIRCEIAGNKSLLNTSIGSEGQLPEDDHLKQLALYMDMVVIPDPIFALTDEGNSTHQPLSKLIGVSPTTSIDRARLAKDVTYVKRNSYSVANQYIKFFPVSLLHEPPKELPLLFSEDNFQSSLPRHIMRYYHDNVRVHNVRREMGHMTVDTNKPLELGTTIYVRFSDENNGKAMLYQYTRSELVEMDEATGMATFKYIIPDDITKDSFDNWVAHSINKAAVNACEDTFKEILLSKQLNCSYMTRSPFISGLLNMSATKDSVKSDLANLAMKLELPVVDGLQMNDIISIRQNSGEAFHNFRNALNERLLSLRLINDANELKKRLDNISYELSETQVATVKKEYRKILRSLGVDIAVFSASLLASYYTGGLTLIGAAGAAFKGIGDYKKYLSEVKENNGYFFWKINREASKC